MKAGLAHSWAIIALNIILLAVGLFAVYSLLVRELFADKTVILIFCSLFLLSSVVIKHFTIPLTDVPFFCCSMCCLAVMSRATKMDWNLRFAVFLMAAWILALAAMALRRIGVALIPPLIIVVACNPRFKMVLKALSHRKKAIIALISVFAGIGTMAIVLKTSTLSDFLSVAKKFKITAVREMGFGFPPKL